MSVRQIASYDPGSNVPNNLNNLQRIEIVQCSIQQIIYEMI